MEVERLLRAGDLDPDDIHLPGVFVDHVVMTASPIPADLPRRAAALTKG